MYDNVPCPMQLQTSARTANTHIATQHIIVYARRMRERPHRSLGHSEHPRSADTDSATAWPLCVTAAQTAMGNGDRGPLAQRRAFTIHQLTLVCLKLKLGKSACRDGFYTDFWHKVAVRLIGDSSGREWRKDRTIMHAMLAAVNATLAGEMLHPGPLGDAGDCARAEAAPIGAGCGRLSRWYAHEQ
jgi:hypothetical protein